MTPRPDLPSGATQREHLDRCLRRFTDAALDGRDDDAREAFTDAQALPVLAAERDAVGAWVERELRLLDELGAVDDLERLRPAQVEARLSRARSRTPWAKPTVRSRQERAVERQRTSPGTPADQQDHTHNTKEKT